MHTGQSYAIAFTTKQVTKDVLLPPFLMEHFPLSQINDLT